MREVGGRKAMVPSTRPTPSPDTTDCPRHSGAQHGGTRVGELRWSARGARGVADMGRRASGGRYAECRGGPRYGTRAGPVAKTRGVLGRGGPPGTPP